MSRTIRLTSICMLLAALRLSADTPTSAANYTALLPPAVIAKGSLFEMPFSGADVYICTVVPNTLKKTGYHGEVQLKVIRSLTGAAEKTLRVHFDLPYFISGFNLVEEGRAATEQARAAAVWPDLSNAKPDDQIRIAIDKKKDAANGYDGRPVDVFQLMGSDDPIIDQVQRIIKLRDAKSVDELKIQCRQILEARAGIMAVQAAAFVTLDRIAAVDPATAMELITLRLQCPDKISDEELDKELTFLDKYLDAHDIGREQLGDALIPLLTASPEEFHFGLPFDQEETSRRSLDHKVLHVLAKVINDVHVGVNSRRKSALRAVMEDLKTGNKDDDANKVLEWAKTVQPWDGRV